MTEITARAIFDTLLFFNILIWGALLWKAILEKKGKGRNG